MKKITLLSLFFAITCSALFGKQIKVLAIGNSFSEDAVENYLYDLVQANGDTILIGNMYIAGCSLERHFGNYQTNGANYSFRKIAINGQRTVNEGFTLDEAMKNEKWDYVSFQQVSQHTGVFETYFPYIDSLVAYAKETVGNPDLKIILHQTWAYAQNSTHPGFKIYGNDQLTMYHSIVDATLKVAEQAGADLIFPSGTAIQNARTSTLGDTFCIDGYHLNHTYGRYTAACVWFEKLFGISAIGSKYYPDTITPFQAKVAQYAAHYAVRHPFTITSLAGLKE